MALALARKYRPKRFSDLLVQDHVAAVLRGAIVKNRVGHGYLLTGPRGVGKTTAARILAMALNCQRKGTTEPPGEPCGECESCLRIWSGHANLDVVEIDAASNRGVEDARDLRERAMYAASREGDHKVYIVDEAHMLTREAWNALLKILEEPPPGVVFVFATTEPQKIAQAAAPVLSRLQRFDFRRIATPAIRDRLREVLAAEQIQADEDALVLIARQADGGMRDALSVLDQCLSFGEGVVTSARVREVLGLVPEDAYAELLGIVADRRPAGVFTLLDRLLDSGADLAQFAAGAAEALRALLMLQLGAEPEGLTDSLREVITLAKDRLQPGDLLRMLRLFTESEAPIRRSANPRLVLETLLLRWALMDRTVDLQAVLSSGGQSGPGLESGRGGQSGPGRSQPSGPPPEIAGRPPSGERTTPRLGEMVPKADSPPLAPTPPSTPTAFTLEALTSSWPEIVAVARAQSRFLGEALGVAQVVQVDAPGVAISLPGGNPMHAETLQRQREAAEAIISQFVSGPVRVSVTEVGSSRSRRLSEVESRSERLRTLRGKDPALEVAAESLDLEVLD